jgi:hypothetical protein
MQSAVPRYNKLIIGSGSRPETVSNLGGGIGPAAMAGRGNGMKWRVMVELIGGDGTIRTHEISTGGSNTAECSAATVGLTLADGKRILAALQNDLVRAQAEDHCRQRRVCSHCRSQRPLKDVRTRRLTSLFGTVEIPAPRFLPCRCALIGRHTLNPVAEIMPDRWIAVLTLTLNAPAAPRREAPFSTASTTRSRRSNE